MKVKKVWKFATGEPIPEGARYLNTVVQTEILAGHTTGKVFNKCWLVWHYFLVEVEETEQS